MSSLTAAWNRTLAVLGRVSMYRLVVLALAVLAAIALVLSFAAAVGPSPWELLATLVALAVACAAVDAIAHRVLGKDWRWESSLITVLILLFVLRPTVEPVGLIGIVIAGVVASASKYLLGVAGTPTSSIPPAVGASVLTVLSVWLPDLGSSAWWVGSPFLAGPVILLGIVVLVRTEKVRTIALFLVVAVAVAFVRTTLQYQQAGLELDAGTVFWNILWSSPFLFLGAFMLSEPLTLPPRRWQQFAVAAVVGILAGWPIDVGDVSLGQERALLIGNLLAFVFAPAHGGAPHLPGAHRPHADRPRALVPGRTAFPIRRGTVSRARGAASTSRRARDAPRVQHRVGARRVARRAHRAA